MKYFRDIYDHIHPQLRDCPTALAIQACREAVIEFCRVSLYWQEDLDPMNIVVDQNDYTLDTGEVIGEGESAQYIIHRIIEVKYNNVTLDPAFDYTWSEDKETLTLIADPKKAITNGLVVRVAFKPSVDATDFRADRIWEDYHDVFKAGTMARLAFMKDKPWTSMEIATVARGVFDNGIGRARDEVRRKRLHVLTRTVPTYGFI